LLLVLAVIAGMALRVSWTSERLAERPTAKGWRIKLAIQPPYDRVRWGHDEWMYYVSTAVNAFEGRGFVPDYDRAGDGVFVPPPGQSLLLLGAFAAADRLLEPRTLLTLQAGVASTLLPFVWYGIGARAASATVGLALAFAVTLHPDVVYWSGHLLNETHYLAAFSLLMYVLLCYVAAPSWRLAALVGLLLGALHLLRPNAILMGPVLAVAALLWRGWRRGAAHALLVLALPLLVLLPWLLRNLRVHGEPIWISSNIGIHLYVANHPGLDLVKTPYMEHAIFDKSSYEPELERRFRKVKGRLRVSYHEYSNAYAAALVRYVREEPLAFARNYLRKLASLFVLIQDGQRVATPLFRDSLAAYHTQHLLTVAGGLLGLIALLAFRRTPESGVLLLVFAYLVGSGALSLPSSDGRYGLMLKPALLSLACAGAWAAAGATSRRR
jgi:hypothetical protein